MLKTYLIALFMLSMATLTISASSLPIPSGGQPLEAGTAIEVADLD
jgi:hypothetical protein